MNYEFIEEKPSFSAGKTPVLFVHGMWHGAWCWAEHFLPYFAQKGFHACALSLRGHGKSDGWEDLQKTSLADYVADVEKAVGRFDRQPVIVGHSMGGHVVQKFLESHEAPAGVLMASVPPHGVIPTTMRITLKHPIAVMMTLRLSMFPVVATPELAREAFFSDNIPEAKLKRYFSRIQDDSFRVFIDMLGLNLPRPKRVKAPMLVLGAGNDTIFSRAQVEATARAYGTEAEFFPDMAHDMMLENGWRAVADRIIKWMRGMGL